MRSPFATAFAIAFGLVVLIGYFIPAGSSVPMLRELRIMIIDWAAILTAFVTLVAVFGLVSTHWKKLRAKRNPDRYSFFMLAGFVITLVWGVSAYVVNKNVAGFQQAVTVVQVPVETSLMALLAVTLTMAGLRLFQRRRSMLATVFVFSVLIFLLLNSGILTSRANIPIIGPIVQTLLPAIRFLPVAGGQGILLGIALGSLMAGLRILFGADRPYSG
jgi:hypothetical protein